MHRGYIKLWRKSFDDKSYFSEPFTRWQAWIDLLIITNYKDGFVRLKNGKAVQVARGQCGWAEKGLAERWRWSRGKIRRFKSELEIDQKIVQEKNMNLGLITIINYSHYQPDDTQDGTRDGTRDGQETDTNKKDKKGKKEKGGGEKKSAPRLDEKKKHGEFVLITESEYLKLSSQFPDLNNRIEKLDLYIGSTGKKYKSHYHTILSWAKKDLDDSESDGQIDPVMLKYYKDKVMPVFVEKYGERNVLVCEAFLNHRK